MNTPLRAAIGDAMNRLRTSDVAGATAAIQRALAGQPASATHQPEGGKPEDAGRTIPLSRRLGEVLQSLRAGKAQFAPTVREADHRPAPDASDGRFRTRSFRNPAGSLTYKLYVPADHAGRELALVMMLHGCTQDPDDFARGTRMNALADEFGLIVAYPHQPRSANAQGCWNWFDGRHQRRGAGEPAVLAGLAEALAGEFGIDRERVFVAGLSAGGAMADVLAATYPDVFCAAGIHSGLPHGVASDVMSAFAAMKGTARSSAQYRRTDCRTIIFHGTSDATVHPSNGETLFDRARSGGATAQELTTETIVGGRRVTRTLLAPEAGPAICEHWVVEGGGHAWSGGDRTGSFTDASGPDASREMIRFFLERGDA
jgi:poly(hydroxyalkanoate) depolymerase family esterase